MLVQSMSLRGQEWWKGEKVLYLVNCYLIGYLKLCFQMQIKKDASVDSLSHFGKYTLCITL